MNRNKYPAQVYKQCFMEAFYYEDLFPCLLTTYFWQTILHLSSHITFWFGEAENRVSVREQQKMETLVICKSHFFK